MLIAGFTTMSRTDDADSVIVISTFTPTLQPLAVVVENTATPMPPTPVPTEIPPTSSPEPPELPTVVTMSPPTTAPVVLTCELVTNGDIYVNVRDYPNIDAGIKGYIEPGRVYQPIAAAYLDDGMWYAVAGGWVGGSVVQVRGDLCNVLPNASNVVWRSMGHVDFQLLSRYREVTNIRVEEYMRQYPVLIFRNGTVWYNPEFR